MGSKKILISQKTPLNLSVYSAIEENYKVKIDFRPFFQVTPISSREFRGQRINILDYSAVVFSSRHAIDSYFHLSEELRIKIPETMKYFCTTEAVAMYLQKHIVFRKRKIFFGDGTPDSILTQVGTKHSGEKFLITTSDTSGSDALIRLFDENSIDYSTAVLVKNVPQDIRDIDLNSYDAIVLYNPADVKSLNENFPEFTQGSTRFISYGKSIAKALADKGFDIAVQAPTETITSAAKAIEAFLKL